MRQPLKYAPWVLVLLLLASSFWAWYHPKEVPGPVQWLDGTVTLTKTKYVREKIETPDCTVQAVDADGDQKPDSFAGGTVTAEGETPENDTGFDIKTTITPSTGETRIYVQPKPQSLFAFENDKELGMRYGLRGETDLYGRWTFVRVGAFYGAVYAEANTRPEGNIMLEVSYRW